MIAVEKYEYLMNTRAQVAANEEFDPFELCLDQD